MRFAEPVTLTLVPHVIAVAVGVVVGAFAAGVTLDEFEPGRWVPPLCEHLPLLDRAAPVHRSNPFQLSLTACAVLPGSATPTGDQST